MARKSAEERFWEKVDKAAGCWEWRGHRIRDGYGRFYFEGRDQLAHRVAYIFATGKTIPTGMQICHRCDNPPCVRYAHLFLGSRQDNVDDRQRKGRSRGRPIGSAPPNARLTAELVAEIRRRYAAGGVLQRQLMNEYGISKSHMSEIINGHHWSEDGRRRAREKHALLAGESR